MKNTLKILFLFFKRDTYVYSKRARDFLINEGLLRPAIYATLFGYLIPAIGLPQQSAAGSIYIGTGLFFFCSVAFAINFDFLIDFEKDQYIKYQTTLVAPWALFLEKVLFGSCFLLFCAIPYYSISLLILGSRIVLNNADWLNASMILLLTAIMITSFMLMIFSAATSMYQATRILWRRCLVPATFLSGYLVPWHIVKQFSPILGSAMLINPLVYILEGLRGTLFGKPEFFPFPLCAIMLTLYSICFINVGIYCLRRKLDSI